MVFVTLGAIDWTEAVGVSVRTRAIGVVCDQLLQCFEVEISVVALKVADPVVIKLFEKVSAVKFDCFG